MGKPLTDSQKRRLDILWDWSNALSIAWDLCRRKTYNPDHKRFHGDNDPRASEMAEMAHKAGCRIEIVMVPLEVDEWLARRLLRQCGATFMEMSGRNPYRDDQKPRKKS